MGGMRLRSRRLMRCSRTELWGAPGAMIRGFGKSSPECTGMASISLRFSGSSVISAEN